MRTTGLTNSMVADFWAKGFAGKSTNGNFSTDGRNIYSYSMKIGRTNADGKKEMITVWGFSETTDEHVRLVMRVAEIITYPMQVNRLTGSIVVGWAKPIEKLDWYYFPDELPAETEIKYVVMVGENMTRHNSYADAKEYIRDMHQKSWSNNKRFTQIVGLNMVGDYINKLDKPVIVAKYGKDYISVQMKEMAKA